MLMRGVTLLQAVGLRGYGQKDPLIEYKLEGYNLFLEMMAQIRRNVIYSVYQVSPLPAFEKDFNYPYRLFVVRIGVPIAT
jgi:preprotein translocase subunit SecA